MWSFFTIAFVVLCAICVVLQYAQNKGLASAAPTTPDFKRFQRVYLVVYLCAVLSDWLQGPYVYALYDHYKFTKHQIGILFIVGFGSSMIFGTFAGSMADRYGRRLSCLMYCALYIVSCLTKHSPDFNVLLFGRLTGGIATSILFSSFESWLVGEHNKHFYPAEWLNQTFSLATLGNGVMAILAGQLGALVRDYFDSLVAPFDLAIVFLSIAAAVIFFTWAENKGDALSLGSDRDTRTKFQVAMDTFKRDPKVFVLGLIQSAFESSMYIFVFMWTPKLEPFFPDLPHGQVFGCFMACMMIGSSCVRYLMAARPPPALYMRDVFALAAISLAVPSALTSNGYITLAAFCAFEAVCGIYWPSMGIIKSKYVPEEVRATMYNIFRIPLNLIVVVVLYNLGSISDDAIFATCAALLSVAAVLQHVFFAMVRAEEARRGAGLGSYAAAAAETELLVPAAAADEERTSNL